MIHFDVSVLGILFLYVGEVTFSNETNIGTEQISFHTPQWKEWTFHR